jgi:hypothetical protein
MVRAVGHDARICNADQLEQSLSRQRAAIGEMADDEQRSRRTEAVARLGNYVGMLRDAEAPLRTIGAFSFKLELNDGRWDVEELNMPKVPRVGDVLSFHGTTWRVRASQLVKPRPAGRPAREVFVCAPVA